MRTVLRLTALLVATFTALVMAVSAAAQALAPAGMFSVQGFDCQQPCWLGIVPGETTVEEAERLLLQSLYVTPESVRWGVEEDNSGFIQWRMAGGPPGQGRGRVWHGVVIAVRVVSAGARLGDLVAELGQPEWVLAQYTASGSMLADVTYPALGVRVLSLAAGYRQVSPELPIIEVIYLPYVRPRPGWSMPWQGFTLARYIADNECGAC